jgi:hypothetical protein
MLDRFDEGALSGSFRANLFPAMRREQGLRVGARLALGEGLARGERNIIRRQVRALVDRGAHPVEDSLRRLDVGGRAAEVQFVAVQAHDDRNESLERSEIPIEVTAEVQRVAQTRQLENALRLRRRFRQRRALSASSTLVEGPQGEWRPQRLGDDHRAEQAMTIRESDEQPVEMPMLRRDFVRA